jgi:anti-anti-sigma factor
VRADEVPPVGLELTTTWVDRENAVLAVAGDIDMATVDRLARAMSLILAAAHVRRLMVDLAEVAFMDARGVATLMSAHRQGAARGVAVVVINCQWLPMRILEITGVDKLLTGRLA